MSAHLPARQVGVGQLADARADRAPVGVGLNHLAEDVGGGLVERAGKAARQELCGQLRDGVGGLVAEEVELGDSLGPVGKILNAPSPITIPYSPGDQ